MSIEQARVYIDLKRFDDALRMLSQVLASAPGDAEAHRLRSLCLYSLGRYGEAAAAACDALAQEPGSEWALRLRAISLTSLAEGAKGSQRKRLADDALRAANDAQRAAPSSYLGYIVLADAYLARGDNGKADDAVHKAIELAPAEAQCWVTRSRVALITQDFSAAANAARHALKLDPDNFAAHNNLGAALQGQKRKREAAASFATAARLRPTEGVVQENIVRTGLRPLRLGVAAVLLPLLAAPGGIFLYVVLVSWGPLWAAKHPRVRNWAAQRGLKLGRQGRPRRQLVPPRVVVGAALVGAFVVATLVYGGGVGGALRAAVTGLVLGLLYWRRVRAEEAKRGPRNSASGMPELTRLGRGGFFSRLRRSGRGS